MKKFNIQYLFIVALFATLSACNNDDLPAQRNVVETSKSVALPLNEMVSGVSERQNSNQVIRSIANTTWDFLILNGIYSWHADVIFYPNGTTMYDEPEYPGQYTNYGTWHQVGNTLYYDLDSNPTNTTYYFTGTIAGNNMSGTYTYDPAQNWSAVKY